jgi:hypothetical protein
MQLVIYNDNTGKQTTYRIDSVKSLYDIGLKYPRLKHIILHHSEDSNFLEQVVNYFNKTSFLSARLIQDNPMLKTELMVIGDDEFKTKLNAWAVRRRDGSNKVSLPDVVDPGSSTKDDKKEYPNTTMGKLASKFAKWRGK